MFIAIANTTAVIAVPIRLPFPITFFLLILITFLSLMKSYRRLRNSEPIENTRFSDCEKSISPQKCQFLRFQILVEMWITFSHYTIFSNHSRFIPYKAYSFVKNFKSYPHQSHFEFRNHLMKSYKCCFCCSMKSMTIPIIHVFVHNFNPSCTKRHFLPLFGQFVNIFLNSLKM